MQFRAEEVRRLLPGRGPGREALRLRSKAAQADDAQIKGASSAAIRATRRRVQADYGAEQVQSSGAEAKWPVLASLS